MSRFASLKSLLLVASLPTVLSLTACSDSSSDVVPDPPRKIMVHFADASEADRRAAIAAALGITPGRAVDALYFAQADSQEAVGCPTRTAAGTDTVKYDSKGCAGASGTSYKGTAQAVNARSSGDIRFLDDPRVLEPSQYDFTSFTVSAKGGVPLAFTGTVDQDVAVPSATYHVSTDLGIVGDGANVNVRSDYACDAKGCKGAGDGDVVGKGRFTIAADFGPDSDGTPFRQGSLKLQGFDALSIDLTERFVGTNCFAYQIDDKVAGTFCLPDEPVPTIPALTRVITPDLENKYFTGSLRCTPTPTPRLEVFFSEQTFGNVDHVARMTASTLAATLKSGERSSHLSFATNVLMGSDGGVVTFYTALLRPGIDTAFTCDEASAIGVRFDFDLADGQHACLVRGNGAEFADAPGCGRLP